MTGEVPEQQYRKQYLRVKTFSDSRIVDMCRTNEGCRFWQHCWFMNSRPKPGHAYVPTEGEHLANMVTHGMWVLPSIAAIVWMLHLSTGHLQHLIAFLYGLAMFLLFAVSTAFHVLAYCGGKFSKLRTFFHIGDRAVIYIFIAASYTPWLLLKDYNRWSATVLCVVWAAAIFGIIYQYTFHERYKWLEIIFYLSTGVLPSVVVVEMKDPEGLYELAIGGIVYVSGVIFFKCDGIIPFAHAIWHCFVFVGAMTHFTAVCKYLLGPTSDLLTQFTS